MNSILVVCEGNICRSPMAQVLLAAALPRATVQSAGLGARIGAQADEWAVRLMNDRGLDISQHRAQQVTRELCLEADMVLVMDSEQKQRLTYLYPQTHGRVFRLGEYTRRNIPDPYRRGETAFREALAQMDQGLTEWLKRIRKL